jgi:hypothetical protein
MFRRKIIAIWEHPRSTTPLRGEVDHKGRVKVHVNVLDALLANAGWKLTD